ncbi:hypothetical protein F5Y18DRAFT_375590 [Xylariaceae sp. FL1019]|nr:hypothetical protein F5Y18DRAFT_375590 [Xylariaceae sp. FL1019]
METLLTQDLSDNQVLYILVDAPGTWIVKLVKAGTYLPAKMTAWGLVSTLPRIH